MSIYRSAQGKKVDMRALAAKNEQVRAVGVQPKGEGKRVTGLRVNARGDTIDSKGNIIKTMAQKRAESYAAQVGNRSAQLARPPGTRPPATRPAQSFDLTEHEKELNSMQEDDLEVENIKKQSQRGKTA
jgi:hypothetical protein